MRRLPLFLSVASLVAFTACITGGKDDTGDTWADADTDADSDTDTDADADSDADSDADADVPHDYKSYVGVETFKSAATSAEPANGNYDCYVEWEAVGTYRDACAGCDFAFDVAMTLDSTASYDNTPGGDCSSLLADSSYGYGFTPNLYDAYGPYMMYDYGGSWYYFWAASFDGTTFTYADGYEDYYYDNAYGYYPQYQGYQTSYWEGSATVSK